MGYEKLLKSLYGSTPQIDLDKQLARVRVPKPMTLDFQALGEGIIKNNMGVGAIFVEADVEIRDGTVTFRATGQRYPLQGTAPDFRGWRRLRVHAWENRAATRLQPE